MRRDGQSFEERARLLRSEDRPYQSLGSVHHNKCKVYKRRWYILVVFSIVASLNNLIWNTWGPIQGAAQVVYGWDSTTITLLADWGPISFVVAVVPMCWLMDMKGKLITWRCSWFVKRLPATTYRCPSRSKVFMQKDTSTWSPSVIWKIFFSISFDPLMTGWVNFTWKRHFCSQQPFFGTSTCTIPNLCTFLFTVTCLVHYIACHWCYILSHQV